MKKATRRLGEIFSLVQAVLLGRPNLSLENRRGQQRLRLRVPVLAKHGEQEVRAELRDISQTGMRLVLPIRLEEDDTVRVSALAETGLVGRQRLICRVAWVKLRKPDYEVGLEYNDTDENLAHSWIQLALRHLDPEQVKRRARRIPANLWVQVGDPQGESISKGVCVNLSTGGCLLQMERQLPIEHVVKLGLGPGDQEPSIFLTGKVLRHESSSTHGQFLHHVQFFPGENRNHQRLRSLMLTLLEEIDNEADLQDEPELDWEMEQLQTPSLFARLSAPFPPPPPPPRPQEIEETPTLGPAELNFSVRGGVPLGAPVEFGAAPAGADVPAPVRFEPQPLPLEPPPPLGELLGRPAPARLLRPFANRSNSLWAARNLPVSSRTPPHQPRDGRRLPNEPPTVEPDHGDFRDGDFR